MKYPVIHIIDVLWVSVKVCSKAPVGVTGFFQRIMQRRQLCVHATYIDWKVFFRWVVIFLLPIIVLCTKEMRLLNCLFGYALSNQIITIKIFVFSDEICRLTEISVVKINTIYTSAKHLDIMYGFDIEVNLINKLPTLRQQFFFCLMPQK